MLQIMDNLLPLLLFAYLILHLPAFILLAIGLGIRKKKPKTAKILLIIAGVYFLVGAGICGGMF